MTKFKDGPALFQTLMLRRAPFFLRVTEADGKFDALDQWEDTPLPKEKLHAYHLTENPGHCHIRSGKRGASGFYPIATYKLVEEQPPDETMRDSTKWGAWCESNRTICPWTTND